MIKPTWLYKPVIIENLQQIQKECLDIFYKHYSDIFREHGFTFTYLEQDIFRAEAPAYIEYLKELGLYDKWVRTVFVGTVGEKRWQDSMIHVDTEDWETRSYALNIPVINCENSHTVWYEVENKIDPLMSPDVIYRTARAYNRETSTEIGRMSANQTAWINVAIPHCAENDNANLRLIVSTRFHPEIHDYFTDGDGKNI